MIPSPGCLRGDDVRDDPKDIPRGVCFTGPGQVPLSLSGRRGNFTGLLHPTVILPGLFHGRYVDDRKRCKLSSCSHGPGIGYCLDRITDYIKSNIWTFPFMTSLRVKMSVKVNSHQFQFTLNLFQCGRLHWRLKKSSPKFKIQLLCTQGKTAWLLSA